MKKITLLISGLSLFLGASGQTFSDDFEKDTLGLLGPQSNEWRTWSGLGGDSDDVPVVNTDNHTTGGTKSIHFLSTDPSGGPSDCILPFGATPLSTGHFTFTAWFKIPTGKSAYFNFQGTATFGKVYALDCFMDETGAISVQTGGQEVLVTTHPSDTWFKLSLDGNLNSNAWQLLIDDVSKGTWQNATPAVYAIDIYPTNENAEYWMDDVSYTYTPYTLPSVNGSANLLTVPRGLAGQTSALSFTARNLGTTAITSFDIDIVQNGGTPVKQSVTGVNIASLGAYVVNITNPFTLALGADVFTATISNVNGAGADGDGSDDVATATVNVVQAAVGKMLVAEEGTGTWCQWCPRGAVYMDLMTKKYKNYFAGIAVHNSSSDPMTLPAYDKAFSPLLPGYPSAMTDRAAVIDPSALEDNFMKRIVVTPVAVLVNGATFDATTRELKVSVTTTIKQNITGDYKVACVITEDSVSGTTAGYNQKNAYAGGASGVMGGFELLPNPVPAAKMNYDHVARILSPSFEGLSNAYGTSATAGQIFTYNFSYTLPAAWDANQIHIIGMMIAPTKVIENATSATIKEAIINGYIPGILLGINKVAYAVDAIQLVPNPAKDFSNISINLKTESAVSVEIYSVNGALITSKAYGKLIGAYNLPVETQQLPQGMYFVKVNVNDQLSVLKLIKE
jgi:hypothetical protein